MKRRFVYDYNSIESVGDGNGVKAGGYACRPPAEVPDFMHT